MPSLIYRFVNIQLLVFMQVNILTERKKYIQTKDNTFFSFLFTDEVIDISRYKIAVHDIIT